MTHFIIQSLPVPRLAFLVLALVSSAAVASRHDTYEGYSVHLIFSNHLVSTGSTSSGGGVP